MSAAFKTEQIIFENYSGCQPLVICIGLTAICNPPQSLPVTTWRVALSSSNLHGGFLVRWRNPRRHGLRLFGQRTRFSNLSLTINILQRVKTFAHSLVSVGQTVQPRKRPGLAFDSPTASPYGNCWMR